MTDEVSFEYLIENAAGRFYYLGSPYTHPDPDVRDWRAAEVNRVSGLLMAGGVYPYATIYATHEITKRHSLPVTFEWWVGFNSAFIRPSAGMIIAVMPGWQDSRGLASEIAECAGYRLPVFTAATSAEGGLVVRRYASPND